MNGCCIVSFPPFCLRVFLASWNCVQTWHDEGRPLLRRPLSLQDARRQGPALEGFHQFKQILPAETRRRSRQNYNELIVLLW